MSKIRVIEKISKGKKAYFFSINDAFRFLEENNVLTTKQMMRRRWNAQKSIYKEYYQGFREGEINSIFQMDYMLLEFNDIFVNDIGFITILKLHIPTNKQQNEFLRILYSIDNCGHPSQFGNFAKENLQETFKVITIDLDSLGLNFH
jgi:hypothetical protein